MAKKGIKMNKNKYLLILIFILISFLSISYSAINTELYINGDAHLRVESDIRITNIKMIEPSINAYETYKSEYSKNSTVIHGTLENNSSELVYEVTVTNTSNDIYKVKEITNEINNNNLINCELINIDNTTLIKENSDYKFKIRCNNNTNTNQQITLKNNYYFEIYIKKTATFINGNQLNLKMKKLSGQVNASEETINTTITAIKKSSSMIDNLTDDNIVSIISSDEPIYMWYDNGIIYYYSKADIIYFANDSGKTFCRFTKLEDISDLKYIDTSKVLSTRWMFRGCISLSNIDSLSNWSVSNVTNMEIMFGGYNADIDKLNGNGMQLTSLIPLASWDVSKVTNMQQMFKGNLKLENLDGINNWSVSNVINYTQMFEKCYSLNNVNMIDNWDVKKEISNVIVNYKDIFSYVPNNIRPNWNGTWINNSTANSTFVPN